MVRRPQVFATENELSRLIEPTGTKVGAIIGTAQSGPIDEVVNLTSLSQALSIFGEDMIGNSISLIKGLDLMFRGLGSIKVVRISDGAEVKASMAFDGDGPTTNVINVTSKYAGTLGNSTTVTVLASGSGREARVTRGNRLEVFSNNGVGHLTNQSLADEINEISQLIDASVANGSETSNLVDVSSAALLAGGTNGTDSLADSDYTDALNNVLYSEEFNYLTIPGKTEDSFHGAISTILETRKANDNMNSRYLTGGVANESISTLSTRTTRSDRLSGFFPGVLYTHRVSDTEVTLDGSYLACAVAGRKGALPVQSSGTNKVLNINGLSQTYNNLEVEQVLQSGFVPVAKSAGSFRIIRDITRTSNSTSNFLESVVREVSDEVVSAVQEFLTVNAIGEFNNVDTRLAYGDNIDLILATFTADGLLTEFQPTRVLEGASADTIGATIYIKPVRATNFIDLDVNVS